MSAWDSRIEVELLLPDGKVRPGELVTVQGRGVELHFETHGPRIALAQRVRLAFAGDGLTRRIEAAARVLEREERKSGRRYQFLLEGEIEEELKRCLRRRDAFRVAPDPHSRVDVRICPLDGNSRQEEVAELQDISLLGLSVRVHPEAEDRMRDVDRVRLDLRLPGEGEPISVRGRLVRRSMRAGAVQLGIEIHGVDGSGTNAVEEQLTQYVVRRQMEELGGA